jgi:hypothetical protein
MAEPESLSVSLEAPANKLSGGMAWVGVVRRAAARPGSVWDGLVWEGMVRRGGGWPGVVRLGKAWSGRRAIPADSASLLRKLLIRSAAESRSALFKYVIGKGKNYE